MPQNLRRAKPSARAAPTILAQTILTLTRPGQTAFGQTIPPRHSLRCIGDGLRPTARLRSMGWR